MPITRRVLNFSEPVPCIEDVLVVFVIIGKIADNIKNRRTVYLPLKRERPIGDLEILSVFNFPHPSDITGARQNTNVATQALFLMNSSFVKQQAEHLARRLQSEHANDEPAQIRRLYLLATSRPATSADIATAKAFLDECARELGGNRAAARTQLCHAILGSNAFLFCE